MSDIPKWKNALADIRAMPNTAPANKPTATVPSAPVSSDDALLQILMLFRTGNQAEALLRFEDVDAKLDKDGSADPAAAIAVLSVAADAYC